MLYQKGMIKFWPVHGFKTMCWLAVYTFQTFQTFHSQHSIFNLYIKWLQRLSRKVSNNQNHHFLTLIRQVLPSPKQFSEELGIRRQCKMTLREDNIYRKWPEWKINPMEYKLLSIIQHSFYIFISLNNFQLVK